jgi:hypothetical protein
VVDAKGRTVTLDEFGANTEGRTLRVRLSPEALVLLSERDEAAPDFNRVFNQRVDQVMVAGRCIPGTHEAQSSYRVMPIAMATGHAAGACAALAARAGKAPRDVPATDVQAELRRHGAVLGAPAR